MGLLPEGEVARENAGGGDALRWQLLVVYKFFTL